VLRAILAITWGLGLIWLTLSPGSGATHPSWSCIICGETGVADALLNIVGFVPLGLLLGVRRGPFAALLLGAALSGLIELSQLWIPGRFPTFADVIWNAVGAAIGSMLARLLQWRLNAVPGLWAASPATAIAVAWFAAAGWLLQPARTQAPYHGQWTPVVSGMAPYEGKVLNVALAGSTVPDGPIRPPAEPDRILAGTWAMQISVLKGPPPPRLAPVVRLHAGAGILYLGVHGEDLVWHERTRAQSLGFQKNAADFRWPDALAEFRIGERVELRARREHQRFCLGAGSRQNCTAGTSPSRSWTLLAGSPPQLPHGIVAVVDVAWIAGLFLLTGLLGGQWRATAALATTGLIGLGVAAALTALAAPGWTELAGVILGTAVGAWARPLVRQLLE
jgi:hypothetical protein